MYSNSVMTDYLLIDCCLQKMDPLPGVQQANNYTL